MSPRHSYSNAVPSPETTPTGGNGGIGAGGVGIGGGIYNLGTVDLEAPTLTDANHASTTEDDVFLLL